MRLFGLATNLQHFGTGFVLPFIHNDVWESLGLVAYSEISNPESNETALELMFSDWLMFVGPRVRIHPKKIWIWQNLKAPRVSETPYQRWWWLQQQGKESMLFFGQKLFSFHCFVVVVVFIYCTECHCSRRRKFLTEREDPKFRGVISKFWLRLSSKFNMLN